MNKFSRANTYNYEILEPVTCKDVRSGSLVIKQPNPIAEITLCDALL